MECAFCGRPLKLNQRRWCSKRCNNAWRSIVPSKPFHCRCGRDVLVPAGAYSSRKYCTRSCATATYNHLHLHGERNGRWRGGRALYYGIDWKKIKIQVRERDRVCRTCGMTPEENGRALDVHHLDPFRFSKGNSLDNLVALCRSCHMRADDHGRKGSARWVKQLRVKPPTKRQIRTFQQKVRSVEATKRRRELQRQALALSAAGCSLRQIAQAVGVSHQTVSNWLSGAVRRLVS